MIGMKKVVAYVDTQTNNYEQNAEEHFAQFLRVVLIRGGSLYGDQSSSNVAKWDC